MDRIGASIITGLAYMILLWGAISNSMVRGIIGLGLLLFVGLDGGTKQEEAEK